MNALSNSSAAIATQRYENARTVERRRLYVSWMSFVQRALMDFPGWMHRLWHAGQYRDVESQSGSFRKEYSRNRIFERIRHLADEHMQGRGVRLSRKVVLSLFLDRRSEDPITLLTFHVFVPSVVNQRDQ